MLDVVNRLQGYDITPKESFKYYQSKTGNKFKFNKSIKGQKTKTFNSELLTQIASYLECSKKQAEEYLSILSKKETKNLLKYIGLQETEIKKLLK